MVSTQAGEPWVVLVQAVTVVLNQVDILIWTTGGRNLRRKRLGPRRDGAFSKGPFGGASHTERGPSVANWLSCGSELQAADVIL
jgi:hypothetical protein